MFRIFLGTLLLLLYVAVFLYYYRKYRDIFHPICFFVILSILRYVPNTFSGDKDNFVNLTNENILTFVVFTSLYTLCVTIGNYVFKRMSNSTIEYHIEGNLNNKMFLFGFILFCIGVLSRILFIYSSGGLTYILSNIQNKVEMVTGNGYLLAIGNFMTYGTVLMMCSESFRFKPSKSKYLFLLGCIGVAFFLFAFMSDRTAPMRFLMIIMMAYHYKYKKIELKSIFSMKAIFLFLGIVLFIVAMPLLRNKEGFNKYGSVTNLVTTASEEVGDVLYWFSYTGRDVFIYEQFDMSNYWLGKNIINFISAPIPASIIKDKPPVDEGYYLANLIKGHNSEPPETKFSYKSSIPFDNQGIMYANFGIIGLIIGGIIIGIVYGFTYKLLTANDYHPLMVVISQVILYNFSLTSHDMVNVLLLIGFMLIPLFLTRSLRIVRFEY